jgi:RNAse (barnase) inhibitor barstar
MVLIKDLDWQTGNNLDAFSDLLEGGFGVHEYKEPIRLIWKDFSKSKLDLGKKLADKLVRIIEEHDHIEFSKA